MTDRTSGAALGYCGLRYLEEIISTEVLYGFARLAWGKGIAIEAARLRCALVLNTQD